MLSVNKKMEVISHDTPIILKRYSDYLKQVYNCDPIALDDKLAISPCSDFITLALVNKERSHHDDPFSKSTFHGGVDQILASKTPLEMDALVTPGSRFVLVEGRPGIGKSTMCWELCRKWETLKSLQDFKIVLQLKLREKRVQNATSLHQLFYHDDRKLCESIVDFVLSCDGEGVLLVLDGFDELLSSVANDNSSFIMRLIIGHECLTKATRLVTSRPSALDRKIYFPQQYRHVELLGFTGECKIQFAEKAFEAEPEILARFKKFIFSNTIITSLMDIPVHCGIIAQVYKELPDIKVPKTMTQLYTLLVLVLIRRHLIQTVETWTVQSKVPDNLEGFPEDIKADLMRVSKLAYEGLMEDDVQIMFSDEDVGESFQHLGLLNEAKEMYVFKGAVTYYSFLHLSIQEFLAAWYVFDHLQLVKKCASILFGENYKVKPHLNVFGKFLSGMCHHFYSALYDDIYHSLYHGGFFMEETNHSTMYHVSCCYEAEDLSCLDSLKKSLMITILNPLDMYMFGYALVHSPVHWILDSATSFDMLSCSIHDHAPDGVIRGSIELHQFTCNLDKFESLPKCLLESISTMLLNDVTAPVLHSLPNLSKIVLRRLDHVYAVPIKSVEALNSIAKLKTIAVLISHMPILVVEELCNFLARTTILEAMVIMPEISGFELNLFLDFGSNPELWKFQRITEKALACSSLKCLHSKIPFRTVNVSKSLTELHFTIAGNYSLVLLFECLFCIAYMSKTLTALVLRVDELLPNLLCPLKQYAKFLAILNHSLYSNPHLTVKMQKLSHLPLCYFVSLRRALRKDPTTLCQNLKRSKSLCDLRELRMRMGDRIQFPVKERTFKHTYIHQSCPDLLELQSLHNMHPKLYTILKST